MKVKQSREIVMSVKLTPDMRDKLISVASAIGQAPATVASFAIGQYVATQSASLNASVHMANKMASSLSTELVELFKNQLSESEESCSSSKECLEPPQPSAVEKTKKPTKSSRFGTSSKSKPSTGED